jgi:hypothetical protein
MKDWGELHSFMNSRREQRDAEQMARQVEMVVTGGVLADSCWQQAEVQIWRADHLIEALSDQADRDAEAAD